MWEGDELKGVDFIPEPTDSRILSAVDSSTIGHQDGWRGEVIGWAPEPVVVVSQPRRNIQKIVSAGVLLILGLVIWAAASLLVLEIPPPNSEWAFEDSGARALQDTGLTGEGVRVCMVDTGIDLSHPDLQNVDFGVQGFFLRLKPSL